MVPEKTDTETRNLQNQISAANQKRLFSVKIGWFENGEIEKKNFLKENFSFIIHTWRHSGMTHDEMTHFEISKNDDSSDCTEVRDVSVQLFAQKCVWRLSLRFFYKSFHFYDTDWGRETVWFGPRVTFSFNFEWIFMVFDQQSVLANSLLKF